MDTPGEYFTQQATTNSPLYQQLTGPPYSNVSYQGRASASQVGLENLMPNANMQSGAPQWGAPSHGTVVATNSLAFRQSGIEGEPEERPAYRKLCNSLEASTTMAMKLLTENEVLKNEVMSLRAEVTMLRERGLA